VDRIFKVLSGRTSSYLLQIANGIAPLLLILFLTRYTNLTFLGNYFFIVSTISITQLIVDYGFNISGLRSLSKMVSAGDSVLRQAHLIVNIVLCKVTLSVSLILIYLVLHEYVFIGWEIRYIFLGAILGVTNISWILYPYNKIYGYSLILLILRVASLGLLFYFDANISTIIFITYIPVLATNLSVLLSNIKKVQILTLKELKSKIKLLECFKEGGAVFTNSMTISLVEVSWPIYLKYFTSAEIVGVYGLADKLVRGLMMSITPLPNFIIAKNISVKHIIKSNPRLTSIYLFFSIIAPISFLLLPQSLLGIIFRDLNTGFRGLMDLYVFQFTLFSIMICIYTDFIIRKIEHLYMLLFIISLILTILVCTMFSLEPYAPFITNLIFTLFLIYKFIGLKKKYEE
jgi:PST family polysaccharide transporter